MRKKAVSELHELGKLTEQFEDAHELKPSLQKEASAGLPRKPVGQHDGKKQDVPKPSGKTSGLNRSVLFVGSREIWLSRIHSPQQL